MPQPPDPRSRQHEIAVIARLLSLRPGEASAGEIRDSWARYGHLLNECPCTSWDKVCEWDEQNGLGFRHHSERSKARQFARLIARLGDLSVLDTCPYTTPMAVERWLYAQRRRKDVQIPPNEPPRQARAAQHGYIYLLTNPSIPAVVKIGFTDRTPQERANELFTTGLPAPFTVNAWWLVSGDAREAEAYLHNQLSAHREFQTREFFRLDSYTAKRLIDSALSAFKVLDRSH